MKSDYPTEDMIRQYLLGRLDHQDELEDDMSRQMLLDDELSEIVDSIEDQIIEDYLDGSLSVEDKRAVEEYFLRPPQHKEKLEFARLLRHHFKDKANPLSGPDKVAVASTIPHDGIVSPPVGYLHSHFRTYCELAALAVFVLSSFLYFNQLRHNYQNQIESSQKTQEQLQGQLNQERELIASLAKEVDGLQPPLTFSWSVFRDASAIPLPGKAPRIDITPLTQRIQVEIRDVPAGAYNVRLESAGKQIWSQSITSPSFGALRVEIPAQDIITGDYHLIIGSRPEKSYWFRAKVMK